MNIKNCVQNEDGSLDFDFQVTKEEAEYLMELAIKSLIEIGVLTINANQNDQQLDLFPDCEGGIQ